MKQILQNLKSGETYLEELPAPMFGRQEILIRSRYSLVSLGTEKMLVQFGRASLFQKIRTQPERVKQVVAKIKTDGLFVTIESVFRRLEEPLPLGYCNMGEVIALGEGVTGFRVGDRVISNGPHAELVAVPFHLVAKVPDEVTDEDAAFTVIAAIGLQGIRLAQPELGETFVVIGLGLIGQITAQLLRAAGCRVIGFDFDRSKVELACTQGVLAFVSGSGLDPVQKVLNLTEGLGADAVVITASTSSNEVIAQSAKMSRKRGRVVLIGVVGLQLNRADFYEKELTFQVSCSYGPGRYDHAYEEQGVDYPAAYVRWTENRNFQAILQAMSARALNVSSLVTRKVPLDRFGEIYDQLDGSGLASLIAYGQEASREVTVRLSSSDFGQTGKQLAIIGAGNFTKMAVLPALRSAQARVKMIVSANGVTGTSLAKKYAVPLSSTDYDAVLSDPEIGGVIITTRHDLHADQVIAALKAGKHVLVEKPLCLTSGQLMSIEAALAECGPSGPTLTVGYNRRFSVHGQKIKALIGPLDCPISLVATMNAGSVPLNHWVHHPEIGGGRLVGEACHFIDFAIFVSGSLVTELSASGSLDVGDNASLLLKHANGSISVVNYFSQGNRGASKERVEIHAQGKSLLLDNFRELRGFGFDGFKKLKTRQDKGHSRQFALFAERIEKGGAPLIPLPEIINSTAATLSIQRALNEKRSVSVDERPE